MKCPACHETMEEKAVGEDRINECPHCRGLWFDRGELEGVKDEVMPEISWLGIDEWKDRAEFKVNTDTLFCPRCHDVALTAVEDQSSMTKLSQCAQCKGVWLGTGQFLVLINALLEEANRKSVPEYAIIGLKQARDMLMNPDSIILEWQNFQTILRLLKHRIFIEHPKLRSIIAGLHKSLPV